MTQNNCFNCDFKGSVAGSCHSSCNYPKIDEQIKLKISMLLIGNFPEANKFLKENFGFTVDQHPVANGWFNFPLDFDPSWIQGECTKHSNNPKVKKAIEAEKVVTSFLQSFKKIVIENQNNNNESVKSLHNKMIKVYEKFNLIKTQDEFFELVEDLKPLITEAESI